MMDCNLVKISLTANLFLAIQALQAGVGPVSLAIWFVASVSVIVVVTLIYVYVLNKTPPPQSMAVAKIEEEKEAGENESNSLLSQAQNALKQGDTGPSIELCVRAVGVTLSNYLKRFGNVPTNSSISDLAYILQSRAKSAPDFAQPIYQLNLLRLKIIQGQPSTIAEAEWALSTASWLVQLVASNQIIL